MYYSATPEFMNFCCKFLGRKVTDDFEDVFVWNRKPHWPPYTDGPHSVDAIDVLTLEERNYENCYTRTFVEPKCRDNLGIGATRSHLERSRPYPDLHTLTVQIHDGRIIRFFPPCIMVVKVTVNETFHSAMYEDYCQVRSPTYDDMKAYSEILEQCTIKGEEYNRLYVDCPIIKDWIRMPREYDYRSHCWKRERTWEELFTPESIAKRKEEDKVLWF